jgi:ABC-2 type transport system permease protein
VIRNLAKVYAFLKRDLITELSYRMAFLLQVIGMFMSLLAFFFMTKLMDPNAPGLDGVPPFSWLLIGLSFQYYFSTALYSFSSKMRGEQVMGTLEAMLVTPTPTPMVIFSSAAWDFTWGGIRVLLYLTFATLVFGVQLQLNSPTALALGVIFTLLSSAGIGIISASFIIYFKRGDPINFLLSGANTFLGGVFFPVTLLPSWLQQISNYLPITWSLRVVRGALLHGKSLPELQTELIRLAILTVILLPAGIFASRFAIRRAKREGSLTQY